MRKVKCAYLANVETHNLACTISIIKFKGEMGGMVWKAGVKKGYFYYKI